MNTTWKAGIATTVITPAEPMWLAGWALRTEPARGTLTDLFAKALAVEDVDGGRFVLLTVDLIGVSRDITAAVTDQARKRWGLPHERLLICASHTHCGPEVRPALVPFFHIPEEYVPKIGPYVERLTARLVEVVGAALADLRPARLSVRQTTAAFAHNRRGAEIVDHDVPVLEVAGAGGGRLAVVFGYACHNLTMPPNDRRYCGDFSGYAAADLEADGGAALFVTGAAGDQNPEPKGSEELARTHGRTLADAVRRCLATPGREVDGSLRIARDELPLTFQPLTARDRLEADLTADHPAVRTKAAWLLSRLDRGESFPTSYPCPLFVARFGDAVLFIAVGGEPVVAFAHAFKRRYAAAGRIVWVAGYADDMFGYVPTAEVLRGGGYEGTRSVWWSPLPASFAEDTEERVLNGVDRLVKLVSPD